MRQFVFALMLVCVAAPAAAQNAWQEPDEEGCKDSKLVTRMTGCRISSCQVREFDARDLPISKYDPNKGERPMKEFEGAVEELHYDCSPKTPALQIGRNIENALKAAGFKIIFGGREDDRYLVYAEKGAQVMHVEAEPVNEFFRYTQTAILQKAMTQEVVADASAMEAEINKTGSVALYGINFDTGKATLQAGSETMLEEIAKLLKSRTDWRLEVQGHTDNVGQKAANLTLSQQRAKTVVDWLTKNGVDASRLVAKGYGDSNPVADNTTDEGRAKNRRVELKKLNEE
jgi:OmpA-OmpF porin, OOP family